MEKEEAEEEMPVDEEETDALEEDKTVEEDE